MVMPSCEINSSSACASSPPAVRAGPGDANTAERGSLTSPRCSPHPVGIVRLARIWSIRRPIGRAQVEPSPVTCKPSTVGRLTSDRRRTSIVYREERKLRPPARDGQRTGEFQSYLAEIHRHYLPLRAGAPASYIPELASADP